MAKAPKNPTPRRPRLGSARVSFWPCGRRPEDGSASAAEVPYKIDNSKRAVLVANNSLNAF